MHEISCLSVSVYGRETNGHVGMLFQLELIASKNRVAEEGGVLGCLAEFAYSSYPFRTVVALRLSQNAKIFF